MLISSAAVRVRGGQPAEPSLILPFRIAIKDPAELRAGNLEAGEHMHNVDYLV